MGVRVEERFRERWAVVSDRPYPLWAPSAGNPTLIDHFNPRVSNRRLARLLNMPATMEITNRIASAAHPSGEGRDKAAMPRRTSWAALASQWMTSKFRFRRRNSGSIHGPVLLFAAACIITLRIGLTKRMVAIPVRRTTPSRSTTIGIFIVPAHRRYFRMGHFIATGKCLG